MGTAVMLLQGKEGHFQFEAGVKDGFQGPGQEGRGGGNVRLSRV